MISILVAGGVSLFVALFLTPFLIRVLSRQGLGHEIRIEGPQSHQGKRGTPSMGGIAIIAGMWAGYLAAHIIGFGSRLPRLSASGWLVLALATSLGIVGFLDDFIKIRKKRNLGLNKTAKTVGQLASAIIFGILFLQFSNNNGVTPGSQYLSHVRDISVFSMGAIGFVVFFCTLVFAWSNAVNFTDGLDGLAAGSMGMILGTYVVIAGWQYRNSCVLEPAAGCYDVRDPLDLAIVAAAAGGACLGFLWWNAAPAQIFMGDTGSLALGGLVVGLSVTTHTELLMVIIGALFVAEILSVIIQVLVFRSSGRRVFKMAPIHHHFELLGWPETVVIARFWIFVAISCVLGLATFYSEWFSAAG
ncbi:phospho-N-acetylmuramoyl-pentapeptide-transferase [Rhodococcus qingshengii]|uniref:phospho-N-acetylmuramoyl-pentapeptide- transferase n=1 Tax=Rhodococcus qingshengii TaxID=334542 RepID=UPI0009F41E88|nr:phospho-N-acetylmuramoyl-pentapeptide-transferase [Rhodococcus qingshengii]ORC18212.1 phospho-N-acetylmuramoyl-pentapeptide-transferase [Rhodococcus qingshengii]